MYYLQGLSNNAKQHANISLTDGTSVDLTLEYKPMQRGWFYNLIWNGPNGPFTSNGCRLVTSPNCLRQYRSQIPFGLACLTANYIEPLNQDDFINGTITALILLEGDEVQQVEDTIYPNV